MGFNPSLKILFVFSESRRTELKMLKFGSKDFVLFERFCLFSQRKKFIHLTSSCSKNIKNTSEVVVFCCCFFFQFHTMHSIECGIDGAFLTEIQ